MVSIKAVGMNVKSGLRSLCNTVITVSMLSGCSSVPDAINPVEWYKGISDAITGNDSSGWNTSKNDEMATPRRTDGQFPNVNGSAQTTSDKGLGGDSGNAKYAGTVKREGNTKTQTARRVPATTSPQLAQNQSNQTPVLANPTATIAAPAFGSASPSPNAKSLAQVASPRADSGPSAPPSTAPDMVPPARPDIADMGTRKLRPVEEQYQRRLAESSASARTLVAGSERAAPQEQQEHYASDEPILRRQTGGRGKGLAAASPRSSAPSFDSSSFRVASIDFNGSRLTAEDRRAIAQVAKLYHQTGGVIRILGQASPSLAAACGPTRQSARGSDSPMDHANVVAHELTRRGVPGSKIFVATAMPDAEDTGTQVFLDI